MKRASNGIRSRRAGAALLALVTIGLAACVAASESASPSASSLPSTDSATTESPSPVQSVAVSPSPLVTPYPLMSISSLPTEPTNPPMPTPSPMQDPLPSVPAAPSGNWAGVNWVSLGAAGWVGNSTTAQVFGWSHGFVGFTTGAYSGDWNNPVDPPVVSYYSSDGVHWNGGKALDTAAAGTHGELQEIRTVLEGPAGLLAVGWSGGCASEYLDGLWTSSDGISWQPVNIQSVFGENAIGRIVDVSGGSTGFVATAYHGAAVWTSADGRDWHSVALDAPAFADSKVNDGTAFSDGYVLVGTYGRGDCGAMVVTDSPLPTLPPRSTAVWWSADGASWTRISLPGATANSSYQTPWICRLSDRALLAVSDIYGDGGSTRSAWTSTDGRNWTSIAPPKEIDESDVITDGPHGLIVRPAGGAEDVGNLSLQSFGNDSALYTLQQSGDVPSISYWGKTTYEPYGRVAVGPTGVVVTDGTQLWIGIPSAD